MNRCSARVYRENLSTASSVPPGILYGITDVMNSAFAGPGRFDVHSELNGLGS